MDLLTRVVAAFEGFSPTVYGDPVGKATVGYGHLVRPGEDYSEGLTHEDALALLEADLRAVRLEVDDLFQNVYLNPYQWDVLTSFAFNVGAGALRESTLRQYVLVGRFRPAAHEFTRWVYATEPDGTKRKLPGLVRRRDCESCWFLGAHPDTVARLAGGATEDD